MNTDFCDIDVIAAKELILTGLKDSLNDHRRNSIDDLRLMTIPSANTHREGSASCSDKVDGHRLAVFLERAELV